MRAQLQELVKETLFSPALAADRIMALRLPHEALWSAVVLVSVLNALMMTLSLQLADIDPEQLAAAPQIFRSPALLAMTMAGALVITIFMFYWAGRAIGGQAELGDILALLAWLQFVMLIMQAAVEILSFLVPGLLTLVATIGNVWGLFILVAFLDRGHRFGKPIKAIGLIILSMGLLLIGLLFFLLLIGAAAEGTV